MNIVFKKASTFLVMLSLFMNGNVAQALSLNDQEKEFWDTQTGSFLHAMYPMLKPEEAVKTAIDHVVTVHQKHIENESAKSGVTIFDYAKKSEEIEKLYKQVEGFFEKEIQYKDTHCIFYHGFGSGITAYNSILHELMSIADMKDLGKAHPLHYKNSKMNEVQDMDDFLNKDRYKKAHEDNCAMLKQQAKKDPQNFGLYKNLKPYNLQKNLGVGKAPDNASYARDHLKSVNLSLFGNSENSGESSFLFYLTSGNIGKLDGFLTTRLLKEVGILSDKSTQQEIDQKLAVYEKLFADKMARSGGGMLQIMMKNEIVDKYTFASWAKGIPYFMNKKNGKFATRENSNNKAIPYLANGSKDLVRPSLRKMIDLYKKNPLQFTKKFSADGKVNLAHLDRAQARLFVNPKEYANERKVIVNKAYRNEVNPADEVAYKDSLHKALIADLTETVNNKKLGEDFSKNHAFGKVMNFVFGKNGKVSELIDIVSRSTKEMFSEVLNIVKDVSSKIQNCGKSILEKIKSFEAIATIKNAMSNLGNKGKALIKKALRAFA